ncbi:hypothetical protein B0H10DRAFT_292394 [Mycena sp. CBHHK59/15]|nr:hypothetical protein B0H10DRAFT_292394 [Mycena sp. CBHHK59/15]
MVRVCTNCLGQEHLDLCRGRSFESSPSRTAKARWRMARIGTDRLEQGHLDLCRRRSFESRPSRTILRHVFFGRLSGCFVGFLMLDVLVVERPGGGWSTSALTVSSRSILISAEDARSNRARAVYIFVVFFWSVLRLFRRFSDAGCSRCRKARWPMVHVCTDCLEQEHLDLCRRRSESIPSRASPNHCFVFPYGSKARWWTVHACVTCYDWA